MKREQRGNTRFSVFTERTVRSILKNPVYAGKIAYGRRHTVKVEGTNNETKVVKQDDESKIILVEGVHEAIVTPEIFAKAETRLGENVRHRKTRSDSTTVYPLTGLIRCPDCGKNIFGYTAPPRPRKNGKEGFYPRYISYRCISGRDRNGISCSLANKYYSGTKLEKEVRDVVASMVSIPEFIELVSKKVDCATDLTILKKKRESIKAEYAKYYNNLMVNEKRLAELDTSDKHYDRRVDSLNRVMDDLYEKIDDSQSRLDELDNEIAMAEKSTLTKQSIFEMLEGFSKYYDVMTPEDRKALLQAMISYIELYGEKRADGHFVKAIHFTFPVTYDGESGALFVRTNEQHVETVVLLSHKKPDGHINVKVEFGEGEGKVPLDNIAKRAEEYKPKERVTYKMIKEYIEAKYGFKVHTAYIAEVKRDLGLPMYDAPNAVEELKQPRKHPTAEKVEAIKDALKHFEVI